MLKTPRTRIMQCLQQWRLKSKAGKKEAKRAHEIYRKPCYQASKSPVNPRFLPDFSETVEGSRGDENVVVEISPPPHPSFI